MTALTDAIDALSPTHYWKLDETSGTIAADSGSGTARDMTHVNSPFLGVNGPTDEDVGVAYNGTNQQSQRVLSGGATDIGTSNTGTMLFFMRAISSTNVPINFSRAANNDPTMGFNRTGPDFPQFAGVQSTNGSGNPNAVFTANDEAIPANEWVMMAFAHSGSVVTIFSNGANIPAANVILTTVGIGDGSEWFDDAAYTVMNRFTFGVFDRVADIFVNVRLSNVAYFDGTALSESQLQGVYDVFAAGSAPIDPPDVPVVRNAWASTLAALNPQHLWKLDETTGDALDTGATGGFDMIESNSGTDNRWRLAPGPIRGQPREYALWGTQSLSSGLFRTASGLPATGLITGVLGGVVYVWSTNNEICVITQQIYNSNAGHVLELTVELDGAIQMRVGQSGGDILTARTVTGLAIDGTAYVVIGVQRADGTGIHIYVDGVDVTDSNVAGGTSTLDSFPDDVLSGQTASTLNIGAIGTAGGSQGGMLISNPFIFVNGVPTDAEIATLSASALIDTDKLTDYFETVFFMGAQNFQFWIPGWTTNNNPTASQITPGVTETDTFDVNAFFGSNSSANNLESGGVSKQIISEFNNYYYLFASQASDAGITSSSVVTSTVGTFNFIGRIVGANLGGFNTIYRYGNNGIPSNNVTAAFFYLAGSSFGYKWAMKFTQVNGSFIQVLAGSFTIPEPDEIKMFTVTQDGTGILFYVDGELINTDDTTAGATYDFTDWLERVDAGTGTEIGRIGGADSTAEFEPNELHDIFMLDRALTSVEIAVLWDAVNGIFPPQGGLGVWAQELQDTGNGELTEGPGPDWWWRMNAEAPPIFDVGIAQNRAVSPINADSIAFGGDPLFEVNGPLPDDEFNRAIYFDGVGDFFEIGVNSVTGELADESTGTVGCFFSRNALEDENIFYSQANDLYTAYWTWGLNNDRLELIVQISADNNVVLTSSIAIADNLFHFFVISCDAAVYRLYIDGAEDTLTTTIPLGLGASGDWFASFTADNSAMGARADSGFTTVTTGRLSEHFIYDGDVLSPAEIAALYEAAIEDGILGSPAVSGVVVFENVTFRNGSFADINVQNSGVDFLQVLRVNRGQFLGGAQGSSIYQPQSVLLKGQIQAQFRGCISDLEDTPVFGRGGIIGSQIDPTAVSEADGSIIVSDCDFESMGFLDGQELLGPVMCQAGFGMSVTDSHFTNCLGSAILWLGDSQRVNVINNQAEGTTQSFGAITSRQGLNLRIGSGWTIRGNIVLDTDGNAFVIGGHNVDLSGQARNILLANNFSDQSEIAFRIRNVGDVLVEGNLGDNCTDGVSVEECESTVMVRRNAISNHSGTAYITDEEDITQLMDLTFDRNNADGGGIGNGLTVNNVRNVTITNNKLLNMDFGIQLGDIVLSGIMGHNQVEATTPFFIQDATTQNDLTVGRNQIRDLGNATLIEITTTEITVISHYHSVEASSEQNLETILGPTDIGFTLILRRASFSSDINVIDGAGNIILFGSTDMEMFTDNDQLWLVWNGNNWDELQRFEQ